MNTKRIIAIAAAAILATAIIALIAFGLPVPSAEEQTISIPDMRVYDEAPADSDSAFAYVPVVSVTPESVSRVVGTMKRAEVYSRFVKTVSYYDGGEKTRYITVYAQNGSYSILVSGDREKHIVISGGRVNIWYSGDYDYYSAETEEDPTRLADEYQRMITWEDISSLPDGAVSDAFYEKTDDAERIFVRYTSGDLGYVTECSIDVASGLVTDAAIYDGEEKIFEMHDELLNLGLVPSSVFMLPDGISALMSS